MRLYSVDVSNGQRKITHISDLRNRFNDESDYMVVLEMIEKDGFYNENPTLIVNIDFKANDQLLIDFISGVKRDVRKSYIDEILK